MVRWDKSSTVRAGIVIFSMEEETNSSIGKRTSVHHKILSAIKKVEFVSDRVLYIVLRGCWCNIVVLNVHAPSEDKSDD